MSNFEIISSTAIFFSLFLVFLSANVIRNRLRVKAALGSDNDEILLRAIRAQGNLIEYLPWCGVLMMLLFYADAPRWLMGLYCLILVASRLSHAYGLLIMEVRDASQIKARQFGMIGTFSFIVLASLTLLWHIF